MSFNDNNQISQIIISILSYLNLILYESIPKNINGINMIGFTLVRMPSYKATINESKPH